MRDQSRARFGNRYVNAVFAAVAVRGDVRHVNWRIADVTADPPTSKSRFTSACRSATRDAETASNERYEIPGMACHTAPIECLYA